MCSPFAVAISCPLLSLASAGRRTWVHLGLEHAYPQGVSLHHAYAISIDCKGSQSGVKSGRRITGRREGTVFRRRTAGPKWREWRHRSVSVRCNAQIASGILSYELEVAE